MGVCGAVKAARRTEDENMPYLGEEGDGILGGGGCRCEAVEFLGSSRGRKYLSHHGGHARHI